jgi:hypothetical protein
MASPNKTNTSASSTMEGPLTDQEALDLSLTEENMKNVLGHRIERAEGWWEKELGLKKIRELNEKRWLNQNLEANDVRLYKFQVPYRDNRIFLSVETLASTLVSRVPYPEVIEAQDSDASRELADDYSKVLYAKADELNIKGTLQMVARHLLMGYRIGVAKYSWDFEAGGLKEDGTYTGDIKVRAVRPHNVIIESYTENSEKIPFIAESMQGSIEELGYRFPDKKDALMANYKSAVGSTPQMTTKVKYYEAWFTFYDKKGNCQEGLAFKYMDTLMDSGLNPYFNYDATPQNSNFLDRPNKPYIIFNFLNQGKYIYDDTSLTEQASSQQDILEKRGRQLVENGDDAKSTLILNTQMIDGAAATKYAHNPSDIIAVKGDARMAANRIPPRELPKYVYEDKLDARNEIDNIFGTHQPLRGEQSQVPTLGQEVISQRSDLGRLQALSEDIERGATLLYRGITQLYKVFATEEQIIRYVGSDTGKTSFLAFKSDKIEDGVEIRVQAGSIAPEDKLTDRNEAVELAKIGGRIDPLTFFKKWHIEKPREAAKNLFYFLFMPDKYASEVLGIGQPGGDNKAQATIQQIMGGQSVPPMKDPTKEYIAYFNQFIQSPAFKQLDPEVQRLIVEHIKGTIDLAKGGLKVTPGGAGSTPPKRSILERVRAGIAAAGVGQE